MEKINPPSLSGVFTTSSTQMTVIGPFSTYSQDAPAPDQQQWETIAYEIKMFSRMLEILSDPDWLTEVALKNAIVEDAVLHARSLCEVFLDPGTRKDDIKLAELIREPANYVELSAAIAKLRKVYSPSYRDMFNKNVMHPTKLRGDGRDYSEPLKELAPAIGEVVGEIEAAKDKIESLKGVEFGPFTPRTAAAKPPTSR